MRRAVHFQYVRKVPGYTKGFETALSLFPVFLFPDQVFLISTLAVDAAVRGDLDNAVCHSLQNFVVVGGQKNNALEVHQTVIDGGDAW